MGRDYLLAERGHCVRERAEVERKLVKMTRSRRRWVYWTIGVVALYLTLAVIDMLIGRWWMVAYWTALAVFVVWCDTKCLKWHDEAVADYRGALDIYDSTILKIDLLLS